MKRLKRIMALVIAMAMVVAMAIPAWADGAATQTPDTYTITVTNSTTDSNASISGHTFSAYKLFDLAYVAQVKDANGNVVNQTTDYAQDTTPHAYYLSTTSKFFTGATWNDTNKAYDAEANTPFAEIAKYFDITPLSGDSSKVLVTPKLKDKSGKAPWETGFDAGTNGDNLSEDSAFTATEAYALSEALKPYITSLSIPADGSATASSEEVTIDVSSKGAGYYLVTGDGQGLNENGTAAETVTAAVALTSTDPQAQIIAKLSAPKVEKEIDEYEYTVDENGDYLKDSNGNRIPVYEQEEYEENGETKTRNKLDENGNPIPKKVKYDEHSIGDTVPYIVTTTVPNMNGYEKYFFVLSDTLSKGLTLNDDSNISSDNPYDEGFKVTFKAPEGSEESDVVLTRIDQAAAQADPQPNNSYYVKKVENADGTTSVELVFVNFIQYKGTLITEANVDALLGTVYKNGDTIPEGKSVGDVVEGSGDKTRIGTYYGTYEGWTIEVQYSATVDTDAAIGETGNVNTAKIIFSNKPDEKAEGEPNEQDYPTEKEKEDITGETPDSKTVTYVTGLKFKKQDKNGNPLKDAEFTFVGPNLKEVVEKTDKKYFRPATETETADWYLLKDGTYTQTPPTKDTAPTTDAQGKTTYTEGTWRLYDQTGWTSAPATQNYTVGGETIALYTDAAEAPWKPAFVQDTMQEFTKTVYKEDSAGSYYELKNGSFTDKTDLPAADYVDKSVKYSVQTKPWNEMTQAEKEAATTSITLKTDDEGLLTLTGLRGTLDGEDAYYTLTEIAAPDGYNMLKEPIVIKIEWKKNDKNTDTDLVADTDKCTWLVKYKFKSEPDSKFVTVSNTDAANLFQIAVINNSGVELPSTGGIGTTIFYVIGTILVLGAGVVLITRRRMDA